jgi:hypothetical protein
MATPEDEIRDLEAEIALYTKALPASTKQLMKEMKSGRKDTPISSLRAETVLQQ